MKKPYDSWAERGLGRVYCTLEGSGQGPFHVLRVRMAVLFFGLLYLGLLGLIIAVAGPLLGLEHKSKVLAFVFGIYIVLPVGLFVLLIRSYLRTAAAAQTPENSEGK